MEYQSLIENGLAMVMRLKMPFLIMCSRRRMLVHHFLSPTRPDLPIKRTDVGLCPQFRRSQSGSDVFAYGDGEIPIMVVSLVKPEETKKRRNEEMEDDA